MTERLKATLLAVLGVLLLALPVLIEEVAAIPTTDPPATTTTTEPPTTGTTLEPTTTTEPTTSTTEATTTTTEPPGDEDVWGDPDEPTFARADYPTDATTGPSNLGLDEDNLPFCSESPTINNSGTTVEGCKWHNVVDVNASNVTLRGVVILANTAIIVRSDSTNLVIEDSIIAPLNPGIPHGNATTGESCGAAIGQGNYTLRRSEVYGCADGLKVAHVTVIEDSYVHGQPKTSGSGGTTHNDSFQKNDNTDLDSLTVTGTSFYGHPCTSNRHWQAKNLNSAEVHITGNLFYGLHGLINDDGSGDGNSGEVTGNVLAGSATAGPFSPQVGDVLTLGPGWSGIDTSGNEFEDGSALPASGELDPGYACDVMAA